MWLGVGLRMPCAAFFSRATQLTRIFTCSLAHKRCIRFYLAGRLKDQTVIKETFIAERKKGGISAEAAEAAWLALLNAKYFELQGAKKEKAAAALEAAGGGGGGGGGGAAGKGASKKR